MSANLLAVIQTPTQRAFRTDEAAKYLGLHPQTLRRLCDLGKIPARRLNRRRMFLLEDLDAWLNRQEKWVSRGNS